MRHRATIGINYFYKFYCRYYLSSTRFISDHNDTKKKLSNLCCLTPLYYPYFTIIHVLLNYLILASIFSIFLPSMTSLMRFVCNFLLSSNV
ncbi:hypothetical protein B8A12_06365 [Staphylococcus aureus]|nr:hypothetical protein TW63_01490 [Staphylococcus aureus]ATW79217.1 hypothetical protein CFN13_01830 [Staphylococcus aureus]MDH2930064.1 hypothetical protein [Staphylococcus aureus]OFC58048.1 hypothetical protein BA765_04955 [Staphylococcus aureus]OHW14585.1 hypothetical protein BKL86_07895 [Staphylococcus aureus]